MPGKATGGAGACAEADALHTLPAPRTSERPAARRKNRRSVPIRLPLSECPRPINTAGEDQMPASTDDGQILTFVSDRPGGKGAWTSTDRTDLKRSCESPAH